jgi:GDPmannose 4,6-dehydratase
MWRILQQEEPSDFVLASGEAHSIREFCELAFAEIGVELKWEGSGDQEKAIDVATGKTMISINPEYYRPAEVDLLLGNPKRAEEVLGWKRKVDFPGLVKLMVAHDLEAEK